MFYFNPLPPYGGRPRNCPASRFFSAISIHSLRMEGDLPAHVVRFRIPYFNPLPPYGGRRQCRRRNDGHNRFQSTPSVWRETSPIFSPNFSPSGISIHSLRMEGDYDSACPFPGRRHFNPLPPYGGRPPIFRSRFRIDDISIHSLRMEGDGNSQTFGEWLEISIHSLRMEGDCLLL